MRPPIGLLHDERGLDLARRDDAIDLRLGLAKNGDRAARRAQRALGALLIGNRGLIVVLIDALDRVQRLGAVQCAARLLERRRRRDEIRLRGDEIGALDREEHLALLDRIAEIREGLNDAALIGREHLDVQVLVEIDVADGLLFGRELALGDRSHADRVQLRVRQRHRVRPRRRGRLTGRRRRRSGARGGTGCPGARSEVHCGAENRKAGDRCQR